MGIRPTGNGPKPTYGQDDTTSRYQDWVTDLEQAGDTGGDVLVEIDAKAGSANQTMSDLAAALTTLESQPLLLHWDGTGARPTLRPGWALLNTSTGVIEKG